MFYYQDLSLKVSLSVLGFACVQNVIRTALILVSIWGLVAFAAPAQAAHCDDMASHTMANHKMISHAHNMDAGTSTIAKAMMGHDCCSPDCHCPSALCGAGHGVPLSAAVILPTFGTTELIQFNTDLYSLLPLSLLIKPPMVA